MFMLIPRSIILTNVLSWSVCSYGDGAMHVVPLVSLWVTICLSGDKVADVPYRIMFPTKSVSKCVSERVSMIHKLTTPKKVSR